MAAPAARTQRRVRPTPLKTQVGQVVFTVPLRTISGLRWLTWIALGNNLAHPLDGRVLPADRVVGVGAGRLAAARLPRPAG